MLKETGGSSAWNLELIHEGDQEQLSEGSKSSDQHRELQSEQEEVRKSHEEIRLE